MSKENPKYRTHDSPAFVEPVVDWGVSLTDPSQDISIEKLVALHIRRGAPAHGLSYGEDLSRVGFTELHLQASDLADKVRGSVEAEKVEADKAAAAKAAAAKAAAVESVVKASGLKPDSPELATLRSELTRVLPGFEEPLAP